MKKISKIKRITLLFIVLLTIIITIYTILFAMPNKGKEKKIEESNKIKFGYVLYKRDNSLYKGIFNNLKNVLNDDINYDKYAEYVSELFIIDLYTLKNKNSKEDIGGIQYVFDNVKDNYSLNVSNTLYKYIGIQKELPEVNKIELKNIISTNYEINGKSYDAYEVSLNWEYKEDYGYDTEATLILIKDSEKLYVVEKK